MIEHRRTGQRGQAIALFALALSVITMATAVVVDGGYAFAQRRQSQNAADFAAMAGTRIVGQYLTGQPYGSGTAANVRNAIESALTANDASLEHAEYIDHTGASLGDVSTAVSIPNGAFGVVVKARTQWRPFLLGVLGISDWVAGATATAITPGESIGGGVLPIGIQDTMFDSLETCPTTDLDGCSQSLTSGQLNIPGGFGWLKFGINNGNKCNFGPSLGMIDGGCETSKNFLDSQIGPPANAFECCTSVGLPGSSDRIGSLTGNEWGDISFYEDNQVPVWVPVWDHAGGGGANAYYHIVGFGPLLLTGDDEHAKWLEGVAVEASCALPGKKYCAAPGGAFIVDATGEVQLRH